ncbi:MAG: sulfite exporter TauE/SafE family protein [Candidatus Lambdaproteobacteria bacterium]|nr:sulfite exporter TauE/SafE family protein [Candidatus Lambdaproteobacteria bacterium]
MLEPWEYALVSGVAVFGSFLGAVAGFGQGAILLPILVYKFGIREGTMVMVVAALVGNSSRVWFNRREVAWPVAGWYLLGALPLTVAGAFVFVKAPAGFLTRLLGAFMVGILIWRRLRARPPRPHAVQWFLPLGAIFGLLGGMVQGIGPLIAPFFLAFGLIRGAYIATDSITSVAMSLVKLTVFGSNGLLTARVLTMALILTPSVVAGAYLGKRFVDRLPERVFVAIIEVTLLIAGVGFLLRA